MESVPIHSLNLIPSFYFTRFLCWSVGTTGVRICENGARNSKAPRSIERWCVITCWWVHLALLVLGVRIAKPRQSCSCSLCREFVFPYKLASMTISMSKFCTLARREEQCQPCPVHLWHSFNINWDSSTSIFVLLKLREPNGYVQPK